jgi:hypothetical protein
MVTIIVKAVFLIFWILSVGSSVYFFNRTAKSVTTMQELIGFILFYSFIVISSTIVSFSVLFASKKSE